MGKCVIQRVPKATTVSTAARQRIYKSIRTLDGIPRVNSSEHYGFK